ncbi:MAG: hypothetical protein IJI41_10590 [Anaerolineaceae bacterium]|nr:hypothetical protein [Anaerolineaceae bacterium]
MNSYHGNNKPYIYVVCNEDKMSDDILSVLESNNIAVCLSKGFNNKEKKYIEAAYGVLLFIDNKLQSDSDFRKIIDTAVYNNKNILCVYKEEVKLDAVLSMQLDPQQAIFAYQYENKEELHDRILKAVIFHDMKITPEQKRFQRNRSLTMVIVPIVAALILYTTVIYPLLIAPVKQDDSVLEQFGLAGLSDEDLKKITSLHIVGNKVFTNTEEIEMVYCSTDDLNSRLLNYHVQLVGDEDLIAGETGETELGTIDDISILKKMPNLSRLTIAGENISDISPIFELKNLKELSLCNNPIESIEGIEGCTSLESILLIETLVSDISPLYEIDSLKHVELYKCKYLNDISGIENSNINYLNLTDSGISEIAHLPQTENFHLSMLALGRLPDYSFLEDPINYSNIYLHTSINDLKPHLDKMKVNGMFYYTGDNRGDRLGDLSRIDELKGLDLSGELHLLGCYNLYSLDGFAEIFPNVTYLDLFYCPYITDLSPLLESNITKLTISDFNAYLITDEFAQKGIEIEILQ